MVREIITFHISLNDYECIKIDIASWMLVSISSLLELNYQENLKIDMICIYNDNTRYFCNLRPLFQISKFHCILSKKNFNNFWTFFWRNQITSPDLSSPNLNTQYIIRSRIPFNWRQNWRSNLSEFEHISERES
jgi:hypothetical protein